MIISRKVPMPVQKTYNLCVIIVCRPKFLDCLSIVGQYVIFVCGQVKFLLLGASACLLFGLATMSLCYKCCCASSMSLSLLWELHSDKHFAHLLEEPSHCSCEGLCCSCKHFKHLVCVNPKLCKCMPCCKFK